MENTNNIQYYYCLKNVDKHPVPVKVIQERKRHNKSNRVEITRDLGGNAGFWVDKSDLIIK